MNISVPHGPPMYLRAFKFYLQNGHNSATFAEINTDAAANNEVKLFYGNVKKFETVSSGVNVVGTTTSTQLAVTGVSTFTGTSNLSRIESTATSFGIINTADRILMKANNRIDLADNRVRFQSRDQSTVLLDAVQGSSGYVKLYHNNNVVAFTSQDALTVTGRTANSGMIEVSSNQGANNNDRFRIHKTSAASRLTIQAYSSGSWVENIRITAGGAVELKHSNGTTHLQTTSSGISVTGNISATGNLSPSGTLYISDAIEHTDDSNTKIRFPADDTFTIETNNTERFRIGSNGYIGVGNFSSKSRTDPLNVDSGIGTCNIGGNYIHLSRYSGGGTNYITAPQNNANLYISADDHMVFGVDHSSSIYSHNTEAFRIDSSGRILIGGTSNSASSHADELQVINTSAEGGISIINGTSSMGHIYFGDTAATAQGRIDYNHGGDYMRLYTANNERLRITNDGYVHLGNTGHGTNSVGGQAITGQDFHPRFKIYNTTASSWLMHLRNDVSTNPNGIFMRAGNSSTNYSLYITGGDENKPHIIARGDQRVGIASATPYTTLDVGGSINGGTANQPFQRMFSSGGYQRETKHYFRCIKGTGPGTTTVYDIITVDLNQNFHQAICKVFYGTRLQNVSDSTTQVNEIIFGINRFVGNNPVRNRQVIHQDSNTANHADIDVVIMSSTQYRVRLTFSSSCNGSSFAGGYVELIGVGSGGDGAFYSLAHSHGINY